jgi:hypothetical protein
VARVEGQMIAILKTACGCERAINVNYNFPPQIRVPLNKPITFMYDDTPTADVYQTRLFEFYRRSSEGFVEYREKL